MIEVTPAQVRVFVLDKQGLRTQKPSKSAIAVAKRIHNIQIDTISVVSRSHNLICFNRFNRYKEGEVWSLQNKGKLFEYWSHAICLMPMKTYPFYAWKMKHYEQFIWSGRRKWAQNNKDVIDKVYKHVKQNGLTTSSELGEHSRPTDGWWDWKDEKIALEYLFSLGKLIVAYRHNFQKYYDLPERVIPASIETEPLSNADATHFAMKTILSTLGVASYKDFRTFMGRSVSTLCWNNRRQEIEGYLESKISEGVVEEVSIEGVSTRYFMLSKDVRKLENSGAKEDPSPVKFLSPFDNILRERHYPQELWDFEFKIECYVPAPKRKYGYFVLPILDGFNIVGRVDAKAHRSTGLLELKSLYIDNDDIISDDGLERLKMGVEEFANFHNCTSLQIGRVFPTKYSREIKASLNI